MNSLNKQLEELKNKQKELTQQIKKDEKEKEKLSKIGSIDRLEALIQPITKKLDMIHFNAGGSRGSTMRKDSNIGYENAKQQHAKRKLKRTNPNPLHDVIKYESCPLLSSEEIFTTILAILKKLNKRIEELELMVWEQQYESE